MARGRRAFWSFETELPVSLHCTPALFFRKLATSTQAAFALAARILAHRALMPAEIFARTAALTLDFFGATGLALAGLAALILAQRAFIAAEIFALAAALIFCVPPPLPAFAALILAHRARIAAEIFARAALLIFCGPAPLADTGETSPTRLANCF